VIFSFSRTEIFSTEIESDWISVEKPSGVLEVLEAAGGQAESGARAPLATRVRNLTRRSGQNETT
jgi:hypothetical protein